jgi:hypothetical protein
LTYPLQGTALLLLAGNGIFCLLTTLPALLSAGQATPWRGGIAALALTGFLGYGSLLIGFAVGFYVLAYLRQIIVTSADGATVPPNWPELDLESLREGALELFGVIMVSFGPWWLCSRFLDWQAQPTKFICGALLLAGSFYFLMAALAVVTYDSFEAANPLLVAVSALRTPLKYFGLCLFAGGLASAESLLERALIGMNHPMLAGLAAGVMWPYLAIVIARATGWFYWCSKDELAWD